MPEVESIQHSRTHSSSIGDQNLLYILELASGLHGLPETLPRRDTLNDRYDFSGIPHLLTVIKHSECKCVLAGLVRHSIALLFACVGVFNEKAYPRSVLIGFAGVPLTNHSSHGLCRHSANCDTDGGTWSAAG